MKRLFGAIAAAALLVTPLGAMAQHGGGGHGMGGMGGGGWHGGGGGGWGGGGWHGGGGWGGGGWHGGGGFHGGYYHNNFCCGFFPFFAGFGLGFAGAYPWYYWGDPYGWGPGPYPYGGYYGYGYPDDGYGYGPGAPPVNAAPQACGRWVWRADQSHYQWVAGDCAAPAPQAAPYAAPAPYAPAPAPRG